MMYEKYSEVSVQREPEEPSILSSDPNERKLARRLRIQRRLQALTKQAGTEHEEIIEKTPIERQILLSEDILDKLIAEGNEVVSCVRVANDARELQRRRDEQETREKLLKIIEEEDKECTRKYHEITEKWPNILSSKDPLDIHAEMAAQNTSCLEVLAKKDALIAELRQELENADVKFANDQKKQTEDVDLLIERIENQVRTVTKAYHKELFLIDEVIESERKVMLEIAMEKWEALYNKLLEDSREGLEKRKEIMREYEEEMNRAILEHQEKYRTQKISLELEIQKLQQEVQNMKALCLMNVEKLDYSYAVLKRREEENIIVKNQQKRRINKLQDVINNLKKNYAELEESTTLEIQKLTDQVLKSHKGILDLKEKSTYLTTINDRKYMQIWDMNIESANELLDKILTADRIIHEQTLGIEWHPPEGKLLNKEDLPSYCGAMCAIKSEQVEEEEKKRISKSYKPAITLEDINIERRLLNHIMKQISEQCDYLIEDSLQELLENYTENDKLVIKLDNVFQALDIKSEKELQFLLNFFLPYAYCPTCTKTPSTPSVCGPSGTTTDSSSLETLSISPDICGSGEELDRNERILVTAMEEALRIEKLQDGSVPSSSSTVFYSSSTETPDDDVDKSTCAAGVIEIIDEKGDPKRKLLCDKGHSLEIETAFVSKAVKEFMERYAFVKHGETYQTLTQKLQKEKITVSRNMTAKDITEFWKRYRDIFTEDRERLWDILLVGLKKYYDILKERHQLNMETESLRKQNAELRRLLRTYTIEADDEITEEEMEFLQNAS